MIIKPLYTITTLSKNRSLGFKYNIRRMETSALQRPLNNYPNRDNPIPEAEPIMPRARRPIQNDEGDFQEIQLGEEPLRAQEDSDSESDVEPEWDRTVEEVLAMQPPIPQFRELDYTPVHVRPPQNNNPEPLIPELPNVTYPTIDGNTTLDDCVLRPYHVIEDHMKELPISAKAFMNR